MFWIAPNLVGDLRYQASLNSLPVQLVEQAGREDVGHGQQLGGGEPERVGPQLRRQLGERGVVGAHQEAAAEVRAGGHGVEPGHRLGVALVPAGLAVHQLGQVVDLLGVDREVRGLDVVQLQFRAHDHARQPHPADGGPEQLGPVAVGSQLVHRPVRGDQRQRPHVVAEAPDDVMGLAVDVGADRAADRHLPGAGQHREPEPERKGAAHQGVQADPGVDDDPAEIAVDGVDGGQRGHVQDGAAGVLRRVPVGAAEAAGDDAARPGAGDRGGDLVHGPRDDDLGRGGGGAAPPPQAGARSGARHRPPRYSGERTSLSSAA